MTRIDFYVLPSASPQNRRILACKLTEKAWRLGMKVFILAASEEEARIMDDLLWTFRQGSFIPHTLDSAGQEAREDIGVLVGATAPPGDAADLLINLGPDLPTGFERFERLAELVDEDESVRQSGRQRYRHYKEQGYAIETHKLDASGAPVPSPPIGTSA